MLGGNAVTSNDWNNSGGLAGVYEIHECLLILVWLKVFIGLDSRSKDCNFRMKIAGHSICLLRGFSGTLLHVHRLLLRLTFSQCCPSSDLLSSVGHPLTSS